MGFRTRLSKIEIREVITAVHRHREPISHVAERIGIDRKTIYNHLRRYEQSIPEDATVYSLIKQSFSQECAHPSSRCSICGKHNDQIRREEQEIIRQLRSQAVPIVCKVQIETINSLRKRLAVAHKRLEDAGLPVD